MLNFLSLYSVEVMKTYSYSNSLQSFFSSTAHILSLRNTIIFLAKAAVFVSEDARAIIIKVFTSAFLSTNFIDFSPCYVTVAITRLSQKPEFQHTQTEKEIKEGWVFAFRITDTGSRHQPACF
jgi:hypothetical protein